MPIYRGQMNRTVSVLRPDPTGGPGEVEYRPIPGAIQARKDARADDGFWQQFPEATHALWCDPLRKPPAGWILQWANDNGAITRATVWGWIYEGGRPYNLRLALREITA